MKRPIFDDIQGLWVGIAVGILACMVIAALLWSALAPTPTKIQGREEVCRMAAEATDTITVIYTDKWCYRAFEGE